MIISQEHSLLYWKLGAGVGWQICWSIAPVSPMESHRYPGLLSISCLLPTHSLERRQFILPWAHPEKKQPWTEDWQQKENMGISVGEAWGAIWELYREIWGKWKDWSTKSRKRHFTFQCKSYPFNLMERVYLGKGWEGFTSLGHGVLVMNTFDPSVSFIHLFIQQILTKHLQPKLTLGQWPRWKRSSLELKQNPAPKPIVPGDLSLWFMWELAILRTDPGRQRVCPWGHSLAFSLKRLPNLPNSAQTINITMTVCR